MVGRVIKHHCLGDLAAAAWYPFTPPPASWQGCHDTD